MSFESLLSLESLLVAAAAYIAYDFVTNRILSPLKNIPGPWHASLSGIWYNTNLAQGKQLQAITELHRQHGPLVRVAPNCVSVADADAVRAFLSTHRFRKGLIYDGFRFANADNVFSAKDPVFFKSRKRLVAPAFTASAVSEMEDIVLNAGAFALVERLNKHADGKEEINMFRLFTLTTFDAMGEIMFGESFGLLKDDSHPVLDWLQSTLMLGIYKTAFGSLAHPLIFPGNYEGERKLVQFSLDAIRRRKETGGAHADSLQRLMNAHDDETNKGLNNDEVATELILQFVAGSDTTSATLTWALYRLLTHPECMTQLKEELDTAFPDINTRMNHSMVKELPYLNAVLHETLRVHPVGAGDAHRMVPPEGAELCGQFLPGGTMLIPQTYAIHHLDAYWPESEAFKPERWLASTEEVQALKQNFMPFSVGVRACLGRNLAWVELRVTLAALIRQFDFTFVPGADMTPHHRFIIRPKDSMLNVTIRKRAA